MSSIYIYSKSSNKRYIIVRRRRKRPWTTLRRLLPPSLDIVGALALIRPSGHHHRLRSGLLILPSSIDISSQCLVVLPCLLRFFLAKTNLFSNF
jgi:hypothetical protein